jgi:hypothetical protein
MEEIGICDYAIVASPGNRFRGEIAPEKLAELKAQGIITQEEFDSKKQQLLGI